MRILIIAGPNGAGKTTFAEDFLTAEADCPEFVNADCIAAGLSPYRPETVAMQAARLMLERIEQLSQRHLNFAFETTLATRSYLKRIRKWQSEGYFVELHFLQLPDADWAVRRVAERVRLGGHHIPEPTIRRRYARGWQNYRNLYQEVVDAWTLYDSATLPPRQLECGPTAPPTPAEEPRHDYGHKPEAMPADQPRHQPTQGGLAALTRAAEKAVARARAAGLEPVVRFKDPQPANKPIDKPDRN